MEPISAGDQVNSLQPGSAGIEGRVRHGFADSDGVRIHYAALGEAANPLVVMIHGFPDFWYTWRDQMAALAGDYYTVAIDQRGYNLSDRPQGVAQYAMDKLVGDVVAVIRALGRERAIIIGHDWGGAVAWGLGTTRPEVVEKLVVLNLPHFRALRRELASNPKQVKRSQYARTYQEEGAAQLLTAEKLAGWVQDPQAKAMYVEAFERSDFEAMLNYYKANYPREPYTLDETPLVKVQAPVLLVHGLQDRYLLAGALNNSWEFVEHDLTLVTIPDAGHFVQQDASELVTRTIVSWLRR